MLLLAKSSRFFSQQIKSDKILFKEFQGLRMSSSLTTIVKKLNHFAPVKFAEKWDNVGLLIEPATPKPIQKIILTNDLTENVLHEAIERKSDLIISYHPPIFSGLKSITQESWKTRIVSLCLENRIALYSPHTSWDNLRGSIGDWLARVLPYSESNIIVSSPDDSNYGCGRLAIVDPSITITLEDAIENVKRYAGVKTVQVAIGVNSSIKSKILSYAVCPGSGSSVLKGIKADLYITGEMSHHDVLEAVHNNVNVILTNHSNSERGYLTEFKKTLAELLEDDSIEIHVSETDADPLVTY